MPLWRMLVVFMLASLSHVQALTAITDQNFNGAVDGWVSDEQQARATYGNIADWDVSEVTSMKECKSKPFVNLCRYCTYADRLFFL